MTARALRHHDYYGVDDLAFSTDGAVLVSSGGPVTRLFDVATGRELRALESRGVLSPDGRRLATVEGRVLRVIDTASGAEVSRAALAGAGSVAFSADASAVVVAGGRLEVFASADGRRLESIELPSSDDSAQVATGLARGGSRVAFVLREVFPDDGTLFGRVTGVDRRIEVREIQTLARAGQVDGEAFGPLALAPDGRTLAAYRHGPVGASGWSAGVLARYEIPADARDAWLTPAARLSLGERVSGLAISADGRFLAAGLGSGAVEIRRLGGLEHVETLEGPAGRPVLAVAFAPAGDTLAAGYHGGEVLLHPLGGGPCS